MNRESDFTMTQQMHLPSFMDCDCIKHFQYNMLSIRQVLQRTKTTTNNNLQ